MKTLLLSASALAAATLISSAALADASAPVTMQPVANPTETAKPAAVKGHGHHHHGKHHGKHHRK